MIAFLILLSVGSGALYRLGGSSLPIENITKFRDVGCSLIGCLMLALIDWPLSGAAWIGLFLSFGLAWGAMTTYFKQKGHDAKWWNWMLVGLAFGICFFPYVMATGQWIPFIYRTIITTCFITIWSESIGWDVLEEFGRGFIFAISLLIFLI